MKEEVTWIGGIIAILFMLGNAAPLLCSPVRKREKPKGTPCPKYEDLIRRIEK